MNQNDLHKINDRFAALEARASKSERRLRATWAIAIVGAIGTFALGYHKDAIAQGYSITLAQAATRIAALETKTASMSTLNDADGNATVRFTNVNVQIVSGSGGTEGAVNGRGNLIVGYNENDGFRTHTGSHNIVTGLNQTYSSYGGLVLGVYSTVSGPFASVTGGQGNTARGISSSVSGGNDNVASGSLSSVSGGGRNTASGAGAAVSGGFTRTAPGNSNWVAGSFFQVQ